MKRNTLVLTAVLFILSTFAWAGWANYEYRKQAADRMLASVAQGELVLDPVSGTAQYRSPLKGKPQIEKFSLKVQGADAKIYAPQQVFLNRASTSSGE